MIDIKSVSKSYNQQRVLTDLSLSLEKEGQYSLVGPSGSGKSTLLYMLGGLDRPDTGEVWVEGTNLNKLSEQQLSDFRGNQVGFVFQFHFLLGALSALDNILLPASLNGYNVKQVKKEVLKLSEELGISHCLNKKPFQLSGGEQQRVNIIRALSLRPKLLLCDEPTGNLDKTNGDKVIQLLKELSSVYGSTLVVVTHDLEIATNFDHKINIEDGFLVS